MTGDGNMPDKAALVCAAVVLVSFVPSLRASDFPPLADFRVADPTGQYYVVWKRMGGPEFYGEWGPTAFTIAQRAAGSAAVDSAQAEAANLAGQGGGFYRMLEDPDVGVRSGDVVQGRGRFDRPPRVVLVSSTGLGFVALDVYGPNMPDILDGRDGHAVVVFSLKGDLLFTKTLRDLASDAEIDAFRSLGDVVFWLHGGWINESRQELVIVAAGDELRVVNLVSGAVRVGGEPDVLEGLASKDPEAVKQALIVAARRKLPRAREPAARIVADAARDLREDGSKLSTLNSRLSTSVRLRAAVTLAELGDRRGAELIRRTALGDSAGPPGDEAWDRQIQRAIALEYLPEAIGEQALPVLRAALGRGQAEGGAAFTALVKLSDKAVPIVAPLVHPGPLHQAHQEQQERRLRLAAIGILGSIDPLHEAARAAADALSAALGDGDPLVRVKAALALARVDPARKEILPALGEGLRVGLDQPWAMPVREASAEALMRLGPEGFAVLGEALQAGDVSVRTTIAAALARAGAEAAGGAGLLIEAMGDEDRTVRDWALEGLAAIGDPALDSLVAGLRSPSARVRGGSAFVRGRLGSFHEEARAATVALRAALADDDPSVRITAAGALAGVDPGGAEPVATLVALLTHPEDEIRAKAAFRLGQFGPQAATAVDPLVRLLREDGDDRVAAAAAQALGRIGPKASGTVPDLIAALEHGGRLVRRDAATSLGEFGPLGKEAERVVPALIERLEDEDWHVPHLAATALGRIGLATPEVIAALSSAIESGPGDSELRLAAIEALARLRPALLGKKLGEENEANAKAVAVLVKALGDPCPPVAEQAVGAATVFGAAAVGPLVEALCQESSSRSVRLHAAQTLGRIGPDAHAAVPALIEALADADTSLGFYSEEPLVEIGPAAVGPLIGALGDRRKQVRRVAAGILGQFGPMAGQAVEALATLLDDPDPYVRSQAAYSLGNIGAAARPTSEELARATHDSSPLVRRAAGWALETIKK